MPTERIKTYDYLKGADFTKNLKKITQCETRKALAAMIGISTSTFSTWQRYQRTPYQVIIRLHLALGIPVKDIALPENIPDNEIHHSLQQSRSTFPVIRDEPSEYETIGTSHTTALSAIIVFKPLSATQKQKLNQSTRYIICQANDIPKLPEDVVSSAICPDLKQGTHSL